MNMLGDVTAELGPRSGSLPMPKMPSMPSAPPAPSKPSPSGGDHSASTVDTSHEPTPAVGVARWINIAGVLLVIILITGAITQQFGYGMPPSELGVLERSALIGVALGAILNLLGGMRPQHYAVSLASAIVGILASGRQLVQNAAGDLTLDPNEVVLGISFYEWAIGGFALTMIGVTAMLLWTHSWMAVDYGLRHHFGPSRTFAFAAIIWLTIYIALTVYQILVQCGAWLCPADPVSTGQQSFSFTIAVTGTNGVDASITIPGFITVMLGIGVISFIIGAVLNHRLPSQRDTSGAWH